MLTRQLNDKLNIVVEDDSFTVSGYYTAYNEVCTPVANKAFQVTGLVADFDETAVKADLEKQVSAWLDGLQSAQDLKDRLDGVSTDLKAMRSSADIRQSLSLKSVKVG